MQFLTSHGPVPVHGWGLDTPGLEHWQWCEGGLGEVATGKGPLRGHDRSNETLSSMASVKIKRTDVRDTEDVEFTGINEVRGEEGKHHINA